MFSTFISTAENFKRTLCSLRKHVREDEGERKGKRVKWNICKYWITDMTFIVLLKRVSNMDQRDISDVAPVQPCSFGWGCIPAADQSVRCKMRFHWNGTKPPAAHTWNTRSTFLSVERGSNIVYSKETDGSTYEGNYRTDLDSIISPLHYLL